MKLKSVIFNPAVRMGLMSLILTVGLVSCNLVWDEHVGCPTGVSLKFVYDRNMEFANAFHSKVHCVSVLVFDSEGNYITTIEENGEALRNETYRMEIELEKGDYTFVAYGGLACEDKSFNIPVMTPTRAVSHISGLYSEMEHDDFVSDDLKHDFFHGSHSVSISESSYQEEVISLTKNTNSIRIILQQANGKPLSAEDFIFTLTDDNSYMDESNNIVPKGNVTYKPWSSGEAEVGTASDGETPVTVAYAEFSTSRLTTGTSPKLLVSNARTKENIINIPLNNYLALYKSDRHADMSLQDYLDRENEWTVVFFLDDGLRWINTRIVVNDWVVRINNMDM